MTLTPQAAALVSAVAQAMPGEMHTLGVEGLRAATTLAPRPDPTPIFDVSDLTVPAGDVGVPIRFYRPSDRSDLPLLMWMHGGGHVIGDLNINDELLRRLSIAAQVAIVSVDYRLAPEHPFPADLDDCVEVWSWLRSGPGNIPADTSRMAVGGESAGGTLALALALRVRDEGGHGPDAVVSAYGPVEVRVSNPELGTQMLSAADCEWFWDLYITDPDDRNNPYCGIAHLALRHRWKGSPPY
ncbi:alpha/beta hydrolase [Bacillus cereus]|uniref:alpha/beta hydrolase n=1 Tax=Bacillus cereus TaxID=1396 RepID=UPI00366A971D